MGECDELMLACLHGFLGYFSMCVCSWNKNSNHGFLCPSNGVKSLVSLVGRELRLLV